MFQQYLGKDALLFFRFVTNKPNMAYKRRRIIPLILSSQSKDFNIPVRKSMFNKQKYMFGFESM